MAPLLQAIKRFLVADGGQDLLEYALLIALIAMAGILTMSQVGETIQNLWWGPIAQAF